MLIALDMADEHEGTGRAVVADIVAMLMGYTYHLPF